MLLYVVGALSDSLPSGFLPWPDAVIEAYDKAFRWLGIGQYWALFSPNPPTQDNRYIVRIRVADGRTRILNLTATHAFGWFRYPRKHWRAFCGHLSGRPKLQRSFARAIARRFREDTGLAVTRVEIVRESRRPAAPGERPRPWAASVLHVLVLEASVR